MLLVLATQATQPGHCRTWYRPTKQAGPALAVLLHALTAQAPFTPQSLGPPLPEPSGSMDEISPFPLNPSQ